MKTIRINRAKWRCGANGNYKNGAGLTKLLNQQGYMCCLGFATHQIKRCSKSQLLDKAYPQEMNCKVGKLTDQFICGISDTYFSNCAATINDDKYMPNKDREASLTALFDKNGYKLEFHGEYAPPK